MYLITQFCLTVNIIETLISWNCNLLKILPTNYILNYTRAVLFNLLKDRSHSFVQQEFHSHNQLALLKNSRMIGLDS